MRHRSTDLVAAPPRRDCIFVSIPARYSLARERDPDGNPRYFTCKAVSLSTDTVVLSTPVLGELAEQVVAHVERFGKIAGRIVHVMDRGFVVQIAANNQERAMIAERIAWIEKNKNLELPDRRIADRMVPDETHASLVLPSGARIGCQVLDISMSGAAVSTPFVPVRDMSLRLGAMTGRVVRFFPHGFAIRFAEVLDKPQT
jgi:hypothetical protein